MDAFINDSANAERLVRGANHFDDLDLVVGSKGQLVAVCVREKRHACWTCGEFFHQGDRNLKPVEVACGYTWILLHARCENRSPKTVQVLWDKVQGHQARRFLTKAVKGLPAGG